MPSRPRPRRLSAALGSAALLLPLALAACSTDTGADDVDAEEVAETRSEQCGGYDVPEFPDLPVVDATAGTSKVKTDFGTVELPAAPKAALGMYTTDVDILIWLGYPLASSQPIRGDSGYETFPCFFPAEALESIDTFANYPEFNYEKILLAEPDFILNGLGYDKKVVKRLPEIASTYSVDAFDGVSWRTHFKETAQALGRMDRYELWEQVYEKRLEEVRAKIGDPSKIVVSPVSYWEGKANTGCYVGVECAVAEDLGLTIADSALKNNREGEALSAEQVGVLSDIDYAFTIRGVGAEGQKEYDAVMEKANKNPLWADLEFVKNDHIISYEMEMTYGSPSGQLAFLEVVEEALTK